MGGGGGGGWGGVFLSQTLIKVVPEKGKQVAEFVQKWNFTLT